MERANEDFQMEGLKVFPLQDVEQTGSVITNNEIAGMAGMSRRTGSRGTLCAPRACLSRLGGAG